MLQMCKLIRVTTCYGLLRWPQKNQVHSLRKSRQHPLLSRTKLKSLHDLPLKENFYWRPIKPYYLITGPTSVTWIVIPIYGFTYEIFCEFNQSYHSPNHHTTTIVKPVEHCRRKRQSHFIAWILDVRLGSVFKFTWISDATNCTRSFMSILMCVFQEQAKTSPGGAVTMAKN
jgi:hypothetical protein